MRLMRDQLSRGILFMHGPNCCGYRRVRFALESVSTVSLYNVCIVKILSRLYIERGANGVRQYEELGNSSE